MTTVAISPKQVEGILETLIGKSISVQLVDSVDAHPATMRGLVTNENQLVAVIASDVPFAHRTAAALAMFPAGMVEEKGDEPDEDLVLVYHEVANVLSRLIDEATSMRVRLDPGMDHSAESLAAVGATGAPMVLGEVAVDGYGSGRFGAWFQG